MDYRKCDTCNEKFYYDSSKLIERFKMVYRVAWHMAKEHRSYSWMVYAILATILYPFIPMLWVIHKILYPFWWLYEKLDEIDCM